MKNTKELVAECLLVSEKKAGESARQAFGLGVAGGGYIGLAGVGVLTLGSQGAGANPGIISLLSAMLFCAGLAMVLTAGGELFTGNCLMPLGALRRQGLWGGLLKNWFWVYVGNAVGALIVLALVAGGGFLAKEGVATAFGTQAMALATKKMSHSFVAAFCRGVLCNWLVALSVWIGFAGVTVTDKVVGLMLPITLFVFSGYEHCVANLFFLPAGFLSASMTHTALPFSLAGGLAGNLVPVTLGNIVGGAVLVALLYGWVYPASDK